MLVFSELTVMRH